MSDMLMTILKLAAGFAVLGIIALVLVAVVSGLRSSAQALQKPENHDDDTGVG
jgi:hypothetical protein